MKKIKDFSVIILGVFLVAIGVYFFMIPNNIAGGGINGLAIVINSYIPSLPIGAIMFCIDAVLFLVAFVVIGPSFGGKTIFSSLLLSSTIFVLEKLVPLNGPLTDDLFIEIIFGIFAQALGMAIIFNKDASTGGTDIIAKILNKYFHINMGKGVLMADMVVVLMAMNAFGLKKGLYALFTVVVTGLAIDRAIEGFNSVKEIKIISKEIRKIESFILDDLGRGCTIYHATGSYSKNDTEVLWALLDNREFVKVKNFIKDIDPTAFISVADVCEVLGEGFKAIS